MNYEQKYKEALGWMQSLYDGLHGPTKEEAEHYFPELVESEDEKIRKALIEMIHDTTGDECEDCYHVSKESVLAWLEKQGEKKNTHKREIDDAYLQGICDTKHEIEKQGEQPTYKVEPNTLNADKVIAWLEDQACLGWIEDVEVHIFVDKFKKDFGL